MKLFSACFFFACMLTGCGRHVVVDPESVASKNQREWTVYAEPRAMPMNASSAPAPNGAAGVPPPSAPPQ
jgi:hypothetical protein